MNKLTIPLLLSTSALLSGCPERIMVPNANDFYAQGNNMLCVNHSKDVETGGMRIMSEDKVIALDKISSKKSCAVFNVNDHIITTTTDNDDEIELTLNRLYSFYTDLIKKNGDSDKASGFGPRVCFSKEEQNPVVLEVENHSDRRNGKHLLCQIDNNIESTL